MSMTTPNPVRQPALQFTPGTEFGKYELLATIGRGGMASVILARQRGLAGFERPVVLKVIHPHLSANPAAVDMLLDEARLAAQINHHHVVQIYDLGAEGETYYIAMEYLAGESLSQVLQRACCVQRELSVYIGARIVADAAEGLHAAHRLRNWRGELVGLVHRDVSPGNIVVLYNGGVKVVDFGIAKARGRFTETAMGQLKGKYGYMSPEQIRCHPVDRRADVFSLGVTLWEVLAQRRLFPRTNVEETLMAIVESDIEPPSAYRESVPKALDQVAIKALSRNPEKRFQTAQEMQKAIEDAIWTARVSSAEIEIYMSEILQDRMAARQKVLAHFSDFEGAFTEAEITALGDVGGEAGETESTVSDAWALEGATDQVDGRLDTQTELEQEAQEPPRRRARARLLLSVAISLILTMIAGLFLILRGAGASERAGAVVEQTGSVRDGAPPPDGRRQKLSSRVGAVADAGELVAADAAGAKRTARPPSAPGDRVPDRRVRDRARQKTHPESSQKPKEEAASGQSASATYKQGARLYLLGELKAAERKFLQVLGLNRRYAPAHRGLGFVYQRLGDRQRAVRHLRRYLELRPRASDVASVRKRLQDLGG